MLGYLGGKESKRGRGGTSGDASRKLRVNTRTSVSEIVQRSISRHKQDNGRVQAVEEGPSLRWRDFSKIFVQVRKELSKPGKPSR